MDDGKTYIITVPLAKRTAEQITETLSCLIDLTSCNHHKSLYEGIAEQVSGQREITTSGLADILNVEMVKFLESNPDDGMVIKLLIVPSIVNELIRNDEGARKQTLELFNLLGKGSGYESEDKELTTV